MKTKNKKRPEAFCETLASAIPAAGNPSPGRSGGSAQAEEGPALLCAMAPTNGSKGKLIQPRQKSRKKPQNNLENVLLFVFNGGLSSWEHESGIRRVLPAMGQH